MKRSIEEESEADKRFKNDEEIEMNALADMGKLLEKSNAYENEVADATMKYYITFFKRALKELPLCEDVFSHMNIGEDRESFYKAFSVAKTCINCNLQIKKYVAFDAVFNVASGVVGQVVHHRYIEPVLSHLIDETHLKKAFATYQTALGEEEEPNKLQCVAYLIQTELDKREPCKIPNPMLNGVTKQITAISKYLISLLQSVANAGFKEIIGTTIEE
jgi:hypothetical protein